MTERSARLRRVLFALTAHSAFAGAVAAFALGWPEASLGLGLLFFGAVLAFRDRSLGVFLSLAGGTSLLTLILSTALPIDFSGPSLLCAVALLSALPLLLRRDLWASLALVGLSLAAGVGLGFGSGELGSSLDARVEQAAAAAAIATAADFPTSIDGEDGTFHGDEEAYLEGMWQAEEDLARGRPRIYVYGLATTTRFTYGELLEARYGVEQVVSAGCRVSERTLGYAEGNNQVIEGWLKSRYGVGVLDRLYDEARELDQRRE